jgi:hypothetical protein
MIKPTLKVRKGRMFCSSHPVYSGRKIPFSKCGICWIIYSSLHSTKVKMSEELFVKQG